MRIVIVYTPDAGFMNDYICRILEKNKAKITGVIATNGSVLKRKGKMQQLKYLIALFIILGFIETLRMIKKLLSNKLAPDQRIKTFCSENNIPFAVVASVNSETCVTKLKELAPDVIFNQSQHIVKKKVLDIPAVGVLNRHGAVLPKYRGRLAPFWQILNKEKHGGLTYHLLDEKVDNGPIVWQQEIPIEKNETVISLTRKMFDLAVNEFGHVTELLAQPDYKTKLINNDAAASTYHTSPTIKDALKYRFAR